MEWELQIAHKARQQALEEACAAVCGYCEDDGPPEDRATPAEADTPRFVHLLENGDTVECLAYAIRELKNPFCDCPHPMTNSSGRCDFCGNRVPSPTVVDESPSASETLYFGLTFDRLPTVHLGGLSGVYEVSITCAASMALSAIAIDAYYLDQLKRCGS